jgi:hypothetical protein
VDERLFPFVQLEFPWELGPADGRYVLRAQAGGEPQHVLVLSTHGAARRGRARSGRWRAQPGDPGAAAVAVARATVIDPAAFADEAQAGAWLHGLDPQAATLGAVAVLNRVLFAQRIAAADAYLHELSPAQALAIRAGWGGGEQVAHGEWAQARELPWSQPHVRRRASALRPQERFARLIGGHERPLRCEELALRARLDLDQGRLALAACELASAYDAALAELPGEGRADLDERIAELQGLYAGVAQAARPSAVGQPSVAGEPGAAEQPGAGGEPDEGLLRHALERLEAALRARTAIGFSVK